VTRARADGEFVCAECSYRTTKWLGRCPGCGAWGSFPEEARPAPAPVRQARGVRPVAFSALRAGDARRLSSGLPELDRVLGGGLVAGAVVLVGGEPGVGKSTLLLQAAARVASAGSPVLYVSGEESPAQLRLRGERLGIASEELLVVADTDVDSVIAAAREVRPVLLVVDSVQAVRCADVDSAPGSVTQVRESAGRFVEYAKASSVPTLLVGHVTKEGGIAGPRTLEHVVDTVLQFEGDRHHDHRILRSLKNRFGRSDEVGVFRMGDDGLAEVPDPSQVFLAERARAAPGSAVLAAIEGSRPLLVEVQALVGPPIQGSPRRTVLGVDAGRVAMVLAVLQRRAGIALADRDVFVNVAGGLDVTEPAADLAIAAAVASAARPAPLPPGVVVFGEIGLTGELRSVSRTHDRLRESARLGFESAVLPRPGDPPRVDGIRCAPAPHVAAALASLLP
jgi:DNA repair protein RadA/Sms